jgi:hypothetical protein
VNQIKFGYARWLSEFHRYFVPTTKATTEWASRPLETAMVMVPGRMVDSAEEMLASWRKNDNTGEYGISSHLPVVLTALSKDYMPIDGNVSRQIARDIDVTLPDDTKGRIFKLRQIQGERRAQLLFVAPEEASARSMAMQFCQWVTDHEWRRFTVPYEFAGFVHEWPVMLETPDVMASAVDFGQKNLTGITVDLNLRETIPLFSGPKAGEPNDGKGEADSLTNPHGFTGVATFDVRKLDEPA